MTAAPSTAPRRRARVLAVFTIVFAVLLAGLIAAPADAGPVKTANLAEFKAGDIISDAVFFNNGTMTQAQIQSFLEAKVPVCQTGYTCLKDWYDTSRSTSADAMCGAYSGGYSERASAIIYKVAQACGINPQVILATLQKEQGLVLHTWPSTWRYTIAMGQGCPDTAACDTKYYGFFNQVYGAAWQFKRYANPPGTSQYFTWYAPGKTWNVLYSPNTACGSSPVYIANQATANLYYYTPYQPNAASLRAGYGSGDACSTYGNRNFYNYFTDWFGSTHGSINPFGNVESVRAEPGVVHVSGWAADPDTTSPIEVHVYVGSLGTAITAGNARPDVGAAYPAVGANHGFDARVPVPGPGQYPVCLYGINVQFGTNTLLGCSTVTTMSGPPVGSLDSATPLPGAIQVKGWAVDPDTAGPITVQVTVDSAPTSVTADISRADIATVYPAYGTKHAYDATIPAAAGSHQICATALNVGPGSNLSLGCTTVTVTAPADAGHPPIGNYDSLTLAGNVATARGWAIDPDTAAPIKVRLSVNNAAPTEVTADLSRPDVGAAYPSSGSNHGFVVPLTLPAGNSTVCITAVNNGAGGDSQLGCRSVSVAAVTPTVNKQPFGNFESVAPTAGGAVVSGWTIDPNVTTPIAVHVYVDGVGKAYLADASRPDVAAAYPGYGDKHGFVVPLTLAGGSHQVCIYAIDDAGGANPTLGCRTVTVSAPVAAVNRAPFGNLESVATTAGSATVSGWAIDPDTPDPIAVHIYVDATGRAFTADLSRPDVAAAYPASGDRHGYVASVPMTSGSHRVCVYAIDSAGGANTTIGCTTVVAP
ncbi:hypothetical protein AAIB33_01800 [Microbacterium sp. AZCO]|uniref:hypothetical protein n=1 Tax=Microbacterium sp. AZCO TaxID=3142976 RepID=UPI0031F42B7B